jgi:hypothetical protein
MQVNASQKGREKKIKHPLYKAAVLKGFQKKKFTNPSEDSPEGIGNGLQCPKGFVNSMGK